MGAVSTGRVPAIAAGRSAGEPQVFDFRRPNKFSRDHMRGLEVVHEMFVRRVSGTLSHRLRTIVTIEPFSTDQITFEDYIRSLPNPSVIATLSMAPLPGSIVVEMSTELALAFVDRLLGGEGVKAPMRSPTDIEAGVIRDIMAIALPAVRDALEPVHDVEPELASVDHNPRFVQIVGPTEMILLLGYTVRIGSGAEGMLSLCYPFSTIEPALAGLERRVLIEGAVAPEGEEPPLSGALPDLEVPMSIRLRTSQVPAAQLASLQPGDVIRLDHRIDEPARGEVGGHHLVAARLGRRGRRLAVQIAGWSET